MSGQWGTPLFGCLMDTMLTVDICCCPLCAISRQCKAVEGETNQLDIRYCCMAYFCGVCMNVMLRKKIVDKYGIAEDMIMTVIFGCCNCTAGCSLCQTHRELTLRNAWPGGTILHKEPGDYTQMK